MRRYHPDANPNPRAHGRAQAITLAYSVLRDPAKRASYDEERREADIWRWVRLPAQSVRPPAARSTGIAASVLAVLIVGAVLVLPLRKQSVSETQPADVIHKPSEISPAPSRSPVELEPERDRLADLSGSSKSPSTAPPPEPTDELAMEPLPVPAKTISGPSPLQKQGSAKPSKPQIAETRRVSASPAVATKPFAKAKPAAAAMAATPKAIAETSKVAPAGPTPTPADAARVASLQRISSGFYDQSLQNADTAKKQQLLNVRVRETYQRASCRSDSCVADSYLRQIREVGAIMENRASPSK